MARAKMKRPEKCSLTVEQEFNLLLGSGAFPKAFKSEEERREVWLRNREWLLESRDGPYQAHIDYDQEATK